MAPPWRSGIEISFDAYILTSMRNRKLFQIFKVEVRQLALEM